MSEQRTIETVADLRSEWASRKGSAIGQYRLGHAKVGLLFAEIKFLNRMLQTFAQHGDGCPAWDAQKCTCGLSKVIHDQ